MDDPSDPFKALEEGSKALQEGFKFGQQALDLIDKAFGPAITEGGLFVGDWIWQKRRERFDSIATKAVQILTERGRFENAQQLPLGFGVSLVQNASLEDDESLQSMWAALLANAMDSEGKTEPRKTFVRLLAGLEPLDARILQFLSSQNWGLYRIKTAPLGDLGITVAKLCETLNTGEKETKIALLSLFHLGCLDSDTQVTLEQVGDQIAGLAIENPKAIFRPSRLGWALLAACDTGTEQ